MKISKIIIFIEFLGVLISIPIFFNYITINAASLCPAILILISLLQTMTFLSSAKDNSPYDSAYSSDTTLTRESYKRLCIIHAFAKVLIVPLLIAFALFFSTVWKIAAPIVIYICSFLVAKAVFISSSRSDAANRHDN